MFPSPTVHAVFNPFRALQPVGSHDGVSYFLSTSPRMAFFPCSQLYLSIYNSLCDVLKSGWRLVFIVEIGASPPSGWTFHKVWPFHASVFVHITHSQRETETSCCCLISLGLNYLTLHPWDIAEGSVVMRGGSIKKTFFLSSTCILSDQQVKLRVCRTGCMTSEADGEGPCVCAGPNHCRSDTPVDKRELFWPVGSTGGRRWKKVWRLLTKRRTDASPLCSHINAYCEALTWSQSWSCT